MDDEARFRELAARLRTAGDDVSADGAQLSILAAAASAAEADVESLAQSLAEGRDRAAAAGVVVGVEAA
eukprot:CAMPEP_0119279564 /NCGR_PEP_ID=MMETSP1329-20130426/21067_1 /TAXON_ID=114041 /ORGANISM="Genus nov. species nov., Strain RCC1024" /LENGTH=68 /DNA_ID=CAMNT_0007280113 /DNA_START=184 /DNA_END=387 /DNA_ORIENTATION=-